MGEVEDPKAPAHGERAARERRAREARLAEQMRANLLKRKAQDRERRATAAERPKRGDEA